ncbi:uncharacterized protein LOC115217205 [Argonauta hians]
MKDSSIIYIFCHLLICLLLSRISEGAYRVDAHERARRMIYHPSSPFQRRHLDKASVTIRDLLDLKAYEEVAESTRIKTAEGSEIVRLHEKYLGIPVFDASLTVAVDKSGHLTGDATGTFIQGIEDDLTSVEPKLSPSQVFQICLKEEDDENYEINDFERRLMILLYKDDKARLVYYISYRVEIKKVTKRPAFIIDANSGEVLLKWNNLDTISKELKGFGGNEKSGTYKFSEKQHKAFLTQIGDLCFLENNDVKVVDMENNFEFDFSNKTDPIYYPCDTGYNDTINTAMSPALDAFYFGSMVTQLFREWYNTTILKDQAILRVHFGYEFENAFWDGKYCTFGDGGWIFYPLTSADILGHELAHGFTEQHSGLLYFNESGSINEAFSDMTGEITEAYIDKNDWLVGYTIAKNEEALRYMENPTFDNISIIHVDNFTADTDPHFGSGIYNYMFYHIVEEGNVSIKEAYRVFLIANQMYWHPFTDFTSGACDILKVAYDLGKDLTIFIEALELVGIKPCNIEKHTRGLVYNRTVSDIEVTPQVNPVFHFIYPSWAGNITITATSKCGKVNVKASKSNMLIKDANSDSILAQGISPLELGKPEGHQFFIQLSPESSRSLQNVSVLVNYGCDPLFVADSFEDYFGFDRVCNEEYY